MDSFVSAAASGIALLLGIFLLQETNPRVLAKREAKEVEVISTEVKSTEVKSTETKSETKSEEAKSHPRPKVTKLMVLCFVHEFCLRWTNMAYNSRYTIYITDRWNVSSSVFSYALSPSLTRRAVITLQSIWCCFEQYAIYPWLITTLNVPIPVLAAIGELTMVLCYLFMALSPKAWQSLLASAIMWMGNSLASPASVSIISVGFDGESERQTTNSPDVQGTVISWNNMCCQASLIITPLVLSTIYTYNWEAAFYFSGGVIAIAALVMLYMSCRDDRQQLGKKGMVPEASEKGDIEMQSKEKESDDNVVTPTVVVPSESVPKEVPVQSSESVQTTQPEPAPSVPVDTPLPSTLASSL